MINRRLYLKTLTAATLLGTLADIGRAAGDVRTQVTQKAAPEAASPRVLIVYFTWAGSTEVVAREIKRLIGGDLVRINRAEPYPTEYDDLTKAAKAEAEKGELPAIVPAALDVKDYDIVCIGHPIWSGRMPMPVYSLLSKIDLSGKRVLHFCAHGGSGLAGTHEELARLQPGAELAEGLAVYGWHGVRGIEKVADWLVGLGLIKKSAS